MNVRYSSRASEKMRDDFPRSDVNMLGDDGHYGERSLQNTFYIY